MMKRCSHCDKEFPIQPDVVPYATVPGRKLTLCFPCYSKWVGAGRPQPWATLFVKCGIGLFVGLILWGFSSLVWGQNAMGLKIGDTLVVKTPVCLSKESAVAVAQMDHDQGVPAAVALINKTPDCGFGTLNVKLVRIVAQFTTARGADLKVVEVLVEMADDTWKPAWVLTDVPIRGAFTT